MKLGTSEATLRWHIYDVRRILKTRGTNSQWLANDLTPLLAAA
jgi:hypothetical protein